MIPLIASAVTGLAGSIYGGIQAGKQRKRMARMLDSQDTENTTFYNKNLGNYFGRADTQKLMSTLNKNLSRQNQTLRATAKVTGATPEAVNAQKANNAEAVQGVYSNLGAMAQQWKDNLTDKYLNRRNQIANQRMGQVGASAQSYENLMGTGLNLLGSSAQSLINGVNSKKNATATQ